MTSNSKISIITMQELQNKYFEKEVERMNTVKMGLPVLKVGRKTIIRRDTLERFMTVNQGRNLLKPDDVRKVE